MRIISKFNDYYDSVQAYGQDNLCVYHRKSEEFDVTDQDFSKVLESYFKEIPSFHDGTNYIDIHIIGFCGKLYPVWKMKCYPYRDTLKRVEEFVYDSDEIANFLGKYKKMSNNLLKFNNLPTQRQRWGWRQINFTRKDIDICVEKFNKDNKLEHLFFDHKTPVFIISENDRQHFYKTGNKHRIELNPCLKNYNFFRQRDTFNAYQDISMYISGILGLNDPDIVHISDEDMKSQKGFDDWSFKKLPTKKR